MKEQLIFPEIEYDKIDKIAELLHQSRSDLVLIQLFQEARELLKLVGAPFAGR